jgi:hypothetical protein
MNNSKTWLPPATGVVFLALALAGVLVGGQPPNATHSPAKIAQYYIDHKGRIEAGVLILALAVVFLVFFTSYLRTVLDRGEGESGLLSRVAFAGIIVFVVSGGIDGSIQFAIAEAVDDIDPTQVQTLQALWDNDFIPFAIGVELFVVAVGLSIILHKSLPAWLGWVALALGVFGLTPLGFVSFLGAGVWILIVSVLLLVQGRPTAAPAVASTPPE